MKKKLIIFFGLFLMFMFTFSSKTFAYQTSEVKMSYYGEEIFNVIRGNTVDDFTNSQLLNEIKKLENSKIIESGNIIFSKRLGITYNGTPKADLYLFNGFYFSDYKLIRITSEVNTDGRYDANNSFYDVVISDGDITILKSDLFDYYSKYSSSNTFENIYLTAEPNVSNDENFIGTMTSAQKVSYFSKIAFTMLNVSIKEKDQDEISTTTITTSDIISTSDITTTSNITTSSTSVVEDISLKTNTIKAKYYQKLEESEILEQLLNDSSNATLDISKYNESYNIIGNYESLIRINNGESIIEHSFIINVVDDKAPDIICSHIKVEEPFEKITLDEIKSHITITDEYDGEITNYVIEDLDNYGSLYDNKGDYRFYISVFDNSGNTSCATFYIYVGNQVIKNVIYIENSTIIICNPKDITENTIINLLRDYNIIPNSDDVTLKEEGNNYILEVKKGEYKDTYNIVLSEDNVVEEVSSKEVNIGLIITLSIAFLAIVGIIIILSIKIYKKRH